MDKFELLVEEQRTAYYQFLECHSPQRITSKHSDSTQSKESWRNLCTAPNGTSYYIIPSDDPMFHRFKDVAVTIDFCSCLELFKSPRFERVRQRICTPHRHDYFELFYLYEGGCTVTVDGHAERLKSGDFCIYNLQALHTVLLDDKDTFGVNIIVKKTAIQEILLGVGAEVGQILDFFIRSLYCKTSDVSHLIFKNLKDTMIQEYVKRIACCFFEETEFQNSFMRSQLVCLFADLATRYFNHLKEKSIASDQLNIEDVILYLQRNYMQATLESTASHFHYSTRFIGGFIKKHTCCSFSEMIRQIRLEEAKRLLKTTSLPIEQVSEFVGYQERSYLDRLFKQKYGVTTAQFRERNKNSV